MLHFKSPTPKRTKCWSSSKAIAALNKGPITKAQMKACSIKTVDVYFDRRGCKKFKGNTNLRATQLLAMHSLYFTDEDLTAYRSRMVSATPSAAPVYPKEIYAKVCKNHRTAP